MTDNGDFFDEFGPHTLLKHRILETYTMAWAMKLLMSGRYGNRLFIIDAFAGEGADEIGNPGSPVIVARCALKAMEAAHSRNPSAPRPEIRIFAIEKRAEKFRALTERTQRFVDEFPGLITLLHGELVDFIDMIAAEIRSAPAFFFLDPFGIKGLDAATYPKALAGPQNEIFALFSELGARRLHAQVTAQRRSAEPEIAAVLRAPSLFADHDEEDIASIQARADAANRALDLSSPHSKAHLIRALGSEECIEILTDLPPEERADKCLDLFRAALQRSGASTFVMIPMRSDDLRRAYTLIHASQSIAGTLAMKEAVSSGLVSGALSVAAASAMKADLSVSLSGVLSWLRSEYAGRRIRWNEKPDLGLKQRLLRETPIFNFQLEVVKTELRASGVLHRSNRVEVCEFPD